MKAEEILFHILQREKNKQNTINKINEGLVYIGCGNRLSASIKKFHIDAVRAVSKQTLTLLYFKN